MASTIKALAKFKIDENKEGKAKDEKKKNSKKKRRNYGRTKRYVLCILTSKSNFFFLGRKSSQMMAIHSLYCFHMSEY